LQGIFLVTSAQDFFSFSHLARLNFSPNFFFF
jgi:hypothetical protein